MFPPGGGNDPRVQQMRTVFSRPRPGSLAQGARVPGTSGPGPEAATNPPPAQSVGDHLIEALRGILAREPGSMEALEQFFMALEQARGQTTEPQPSALSQAPTGFPGIAPAAAQSAPTTRGPRG